MSRQNLALAVLALMFAGCGSDSSGPGDGPLPTDLTLTLQPFVASGLSAPVFLAQPLGDGRIFVVEQTGRIRVIRDGVLQTTPFLDIAARIGGGG
ncbi:MAG: glucose dehydrogenase, partial [Gemmatimonadaceae bacterium]